MPPNLTRPPTTAQDAVRGALAALAQDRDGPEDPVNSVVRPAPAALAEAAAIDAGRWSGGSLPPLAGLPLTVKDAFDVAGLITADGVPGHRHVADRDAPAVAALRAAGCVVVGKTNVPERLADHQARSAEFGHTRNPWDRTRTGGGSSGGAAAVAAGHSRLDLGSDMVGSVRMPAAWCGVAALRPTHGLVSNRGHLPWPSRLRLEPPAATVGLTARTCAELLPAWDALLAGAALHPGPADTASPPERAPRLGLWLPPVWPATDHETRRALQRWCAEAADAGCDIVPVTPPKAGRPEAELYGRLVAAQIAHGAGDLGLARPLLADLEEQADVVAAWEVSVFSGPGAVDALVCPAVATTAPLLSDVPAAQRTATVDGVEVPAESLCDWSVLTSVAHCPSLVVPVGPGDETGLPVGAQLLGAPGSDRTLLQLGCRLQQLGLVRFRTPSPSGALA
ncbi:MULTISPECIES: amidase family protein [unclassified Modestobacter]